MSDVNSVNDFNSENGFYEDGFYVDNSDLLEVKSSVDDYCEQIGKWVPGGCEVVFCPGLEKCPYVKH